MKSHRTNLYIEQISIIATGVVDLSNDYLIPHKITDVDMLHRLGDDKEKVVDGFGLLELAVMKIAETHDVSESMVTADIWNIMNTQEIDHESNSTSSVSRSH